MTAILADDACILIEISVKSVPRVSVDIELALVVISDWCQSSDKPLFELTMA